MSIFKRLELLRLAYPYVEEKEEEKRKRRRRRRRKRRRKTMEKVDLTPHLLQLWKGYVQNTIGWYFAVLFHVGTR